MNAPATLRPAWRKLQMLSYEHLKSYSISNSFPIISSCPPASCPCAATPEMPTGSEIDTTRPLNNTIASYAEQVLICTGKSEWPSRIEDEDNGDNLASDLKELLGRGGIYSDPFHNVAIANTSFPPSKAVHPGVQSTSAYLVPSFKYIPYLPRISFDTVQALAKGYILPTKLNSAHDSLSPIHRDRLLRSAEYQNALASVQSVTDVLVLICGHAARDVRCGIYGPLLEAEFSRILTDNGIAVCQGPVDVSETSTRMPEIQGTRDVSSLPSARVGQISHVGGHKFAGNVIIYVPPTAKAEDGRTHPLAGCGIWYGRVQPKHVEGIVIETIRRGSVIQELFRGGVKEGGEPLRT